MPGPDAASNRHTRDRFVTASPVQVLTSSTQAHTSPAERSEPVAAALLADQAQADPGGAVHDGPARRHNVEACDCHVT
ncbi:hypothetical protein Abr02nite_84550 [Paractinoplanes brasiliensis]|nr:hypothetical protein Abr02nite_84550 [Actinoplanes brasiliensis]